MLVIVDWYLVETHFIYRKKSYIYLRKQQFKRIILLLLAFGMYCYNKLWKQLWNIFLAAAAATRNI